MVALSPNVWLQSIWASVRRLHQVEVRLEAFADIATRVLPEISRGYHALFSSLLPRFLLVDERRLEISILSPSRCGVSVVQNRRALQECAMDGPDHRPLFQLLESPVVGRPRIAVIYATPGSALRKTIGVPAGIRGRHLRRSLEYLLEVETPFKLDQVYWGFELGQRRDAGTRSLDLIVAPRSVVDPHAIALRENGVHLRELRYRDGVPSDQSICLARYPERRERNGRRLLVALGIAAIMQVAAVAALPIVAQRMQAAHFNDETARLSRIAVDLGVLQSTLEKEMNPARQAQLDLQSLPSAAAVLRIVEAELGPDTVLDRLSLRGTTMQATGFTSNVGSLTERLEKSQLLKPKSITRNGGMGIGQLELFSIALELATGKEP